ncbi:MAG: hypothetical protein ACHQ0Y_07325 [Thermodesulfovibrionales bacterium]
MSMTSVEERLRAALTARGEELWTLVRDPHPEVVSQATLNRNLTEEMAVFVAKGKIASAETLGFLAGDVRFKGSYKLKLAICKNPRTPQKVTLSMLKFIRLFDLSDITRDQHIPINIRQKVESMIAERIPAMPVGNKTALAKRASTNTLLSLMERGDERVISICLDSPSLAEAHLYKLINNARTKPAVIKMLAGHTKWSLSYFVRFALIRNFYTPMLFVAKFITQMKTNDLKDLYSDPKVPSSTKPFIFRELGQRGETVDIQQEVTYDLYDDDDRGLSDPGSNSE